MPIASDTDDVSVVQPHPVFKHVRMFASERNQIGVVLQLLAGASSENFGAFVKREHGFSCLRYTGLGFQHDSKYVFEFQGLSRPKLCDLVKV